MGDLLPVRYSPRGHRTAPELLYFIHKVTSQARISCHIAVVALIYIERCKEALPRHAVGNQDTAHRIIVASLLIASKFLHGTRWATCQQQPPKENSNSQDEDEDEEVDLRLCADEDKPCWLTNCRMAGICGMYSLEQVNQLERSFLNLIQHRCWVDAGEVQAYLIRHRQDLLL
ncbi:hypothetical protein J3Q64DRAFT_1841399 [Phycomyces blakesleeanus]|uniref:Cyclin N-terminal domain-containing protein n=2 Tax=Phycomyces blakesleeanus TaxID=4837 RepID=A0A162ZF51_PHYB8|nr:hypothetical protein PHYBLDRAFT_152465 [Phycomyces blakesleeanus NRRL 1555(-)]OAD66391.1 hypothetical protein PHYBLDRAFT_152465 [Phycomyces blakesleeanus NRRL 1555(-)]|eukprot:XP_018284431.1 hypothetical protein PHYBLDRAFT_152465 [Phycomyces blakesleeanus NRRL 1555(-)]